MNYFYFEPGVAGGLGVHTILERGVHPPHVTRLHYQFDIWLGDDILEGFPCLIATDNVAATLGREGATGLVYDEVEVSRSPMFEGLYPDVQLPHYVWLKVNGKAGVDDFGVATDHRFVISARGLAAVRHFDISHAKTEPY